MTPTLSVAPLHVKVAVEPLTESFVVVGLLGFWVSAPIRKLSGLVHGDQFAAASVARTCQYHVPDARPVTVREVPVVDLTVAPESLSLVA